MTIQLSDHLTLDEFTFSNTAISENIDNSLPDALLDDAKSLAVNIFEPIRNLLGVPLHVDSGYRCEKLNLVVRGVSTSQHAKAQAVDIIPQGIKLSDAFDKIKNSNIPYDQLIMEHTSSGSYWIHVSFNTSKNAKQRRQIIGNLLKQNK